MLMIHESYPWKKELLNTVDMLRRWALKTSFSTQKDFIFEKKIFLSVYIIRKLLEAEKICSHFENYLLACKKYSRSNSNITKLNSHRVEEHYVFENPSNGSISMSAFVNQIIHSYYFFYSYNEENHIEGIVFASRQGRGKNNFLYDVKLDDILCLFLAVAKCHPCHIEYIFKKDRSDYECIRKCENVCGNGFY
jgi:hypothetical protein